MGGILTYIRMLTGKFSVSELAKEKGSILGMDMGDVNLPGPCFALEIQESRMLEVHKTSSMVR